MIEKTKEIYKVEEKINQLGEIENPILKARAIIPNVANRGSVIRCFYAPQEELRELFENDSKKRVIEIIKGVDEKLTNYTSREV